VTSIGDYAFRECVGLTGNLVIPSGVTSIGASTFYGCSGFTGDLVIGDSVTSIGDETFSDCRGLTGDLIIPDSVTSIGWSAFSGCSGLTGKLVIPSGVTSIRDNTFSGCSGFTGDLVIPNGVKFIGDGAFYECSGLNGKIYIPTSVKEIQTPYASNAYEPFQLYGENSASSVIIYGWAGSYAESYAEEQGYDFVVWEVENPKGEPLPNASVVRFVERMYEQCLARKADRSGKVGWVGQLEKGYMKGADIAKSFVFSKEVLNKNLTDSAFVEMLYRAMLGREADATGKAGWVSQLEKGYMTRMEVTKSLVESKEFTKICEDYGITRGTYDASAAPLEKFVSRFYKLCLERNADQAGFYGWVNNLKNKNMNGAQMADAFFFSKEFQNRNVSNEKYVELLYRTILGREADAAGKAGWVNQLNKGYMTRRDILKSFVESKEFTDICNTYGIVRGNL
ncbi:MAG: DUF4214 domain-containing protein, partial [Bacteroidales bacterium]|nr:DUF4214 domain-containing protein [Bacteroidales bacterium]